MLTQIRKEQFGKPRLVPPVFNLGFLTIVGQEYVAMIHRLGKFNRVMEAGVHWKIPFIESIDAVHDMREWVIEIEPQVGTTKDNVQISSDAYLYMQIVDPVKASYNVEDNVQAIVELAQSTMRSQIGKISMDQTFMKRASINEAIKKEIGEVVREWGCEIIRFELKDINPPANIEKAMILQAEAERNKRAQILSSEGER